MGCRRRRAAALPAAAALLLPRAAWAGEERFQWLTTPTTKTVDALRAAAARLPPLRGLPAAETVQALAVRGTVYATSGNSAYGDFVTNAAISVTRVLHHARPLVAMLDEPGLRLCERDLAPPVTPLGALCTHVACNEQCAGSGGSERAFRAQGCMTHLGLCFNRIKLGALLAGVDLFWIDADAALARPVEPFLRGLRGVSMVGGCDKCKGSCSGDTEHLLPLIDRGARIPAAWYRQVNTGLTWYNHSSPPLLQGLLEANEIIEANVWGFKSVDQTVLNRRVLALGGALHCLSEMRAGLNHRTKRRGGKLYRHAWGVHAARLVSRHSFYKRALLHLNGLWYVAPPHAGFAAEAARWQQSPGAFVEDCLRRGPEAKCYPEV